MFSCIRKTRALAAIPVCIVLMNVSGCTNLGVDLNTDEPIKVDIDVKLDVYQHQAGDQTTTSTEPDPAATSVETRRRRRMGEIQTLKNNRVIGENHEGLLEIRNEPPGEFGAYAKAIVAEENEDRIALMTEIAAKEGVAVTVIKDRQAKLFRERAFGGEWIEVRDVEGAYVWKQKAQ